MSELTDIAVATARIDANVENLVKSVDTLKKDTTVRLNDHADRVKSLELSRSRFKGGGAVLSFLVVAVGAVSTYFRFK